MADISQYLQAIMSAIYGEDVRGSIHDAIEIINEVSEVVLTTGTAVSSASSSSTGFFEDSLYLNTSTWELWKCVGVDSWASQGIIKGDKGDPGDDGTIWYRGTGISGKAVNPTVYSGSGVADANAGDLYLNPQEAAVYVCVLGGTPTVATWSYEFTFGASAGVDADDVAYDNTTSGLTATNVQDAIDEVVSDLDEFTASATCYADSSLVKVSFDDLDTNYGYELCFDDQNQALPSPIPSQIGDPTKGSGTNSGIKLTYTLANATAGTHKFALRILK